MPSDDDATVAAVNDDDWLSDQSISGLELSDGQIRRLTLERAVLKGADLSGLRLEGLRLIDVVFDTCDLSNLVLVEPSMVRVEWRDSRMTGLTFESGRLEDVRFTGCRGTVVSLIDVGANRFTVEACQWPEADFRATTLEHLSVHDSALPTSQWMRARLSTARFTATDLTDVQGGTGLAGASFDTATMLSAAAGMAHALGISVWDIEPQG